MFNNRKWLFVPAVTFLAVMLTGCTVTDSPRPRPGCYAGATFGVNFLDANSLGSHNYSSFVGESDGVAYTCRGGHIDLAHLRIAADNVYYLYTKFSKHLKAGDTEFTYKLNTDPSTFIFHITYPPDFRMRPKGEQDRMIYETSLELAQYGAWYMVTWHEALTWFGMTAFFMPQFHSAFAWEDSYSNLLGTVLGGKAIRHTNSDFNAAMTMVIKDELNMLGVRSRDIARAASEKMRGTWYEGNVDVKMLFRGLDIGADDGFVSPTLVPGVCPQAQPMKYPIPTLSTVQRYGFKAELEIKSSGGATNRCLEIIYPNGQYGRILPATHLPIIMKTVRQQAIEKGYLVTP
jgi:hypothetical protein